jgi:hypothetical protein
MVRWLYPNSWRTMFECGLPVFVINIWWAKLRKFDNSKQLQSPKGTLGW